MFWVISGLMLAGVLSACDDDEEAKKAEETKPILGVMELAISHRTDGSQPGGAHIEISPTKLRVDGEEVAALANGKLAEGDASKLDAALQKASHQAAALEMHAQTPYATLVAVLDALDGASVSGVAFKSRDPESPSETGWTHVRGFELVDSLPEDTLVEQSSVSPRSWDEFTKVWETAQQGCRSAMSGSCAYKPKNVAEGGDLRIKLEAKGHAMNVVYQRVGGEPVEEQGEEKGGGVQMMEGVPNVDPVEEVEEAPPATIAQFQFRAKEASASPSPISETTAPLCGKTACGVALVAEPTTMTARVVSLIGAAFPDGTPEPSVAFVRP